MMELEIKKEEYEFKPNKYEIDRITFQINVVIMAMLNGFKVDKRWLN